MRIEPEDTPVLYGRISTLDDLDERRAGGSGDRRHEQAVDEQREVLRFEKKKESGKRTLS